MQTTDQVAGEAREKLADRLSDAIGHYGKEITTAWDWNPSAVKDLRVEISYADAKDILAALRAQPERGAEEMRERAARCAETIEAWCEYVNIGESSKDGIAKAIRALPAQQASAEWNYDMSAAPVGPDNSVLVTVPSLHAGWPPIVGEAWYCADGAGEGWWWSGSSPSDYHSSPIRDTNAEPIAWRRLPEPAVIRALPLHPAKDEGGGR